MTSILIDTRAAIWVTEGIPIADAASTALASAASAGRPVCVSPITAWEIGMLASRNRISLSCAPDLWFERLLAIPGVRLASTPPSILLASSFLPGKPPNDPADRIIAATARDLGATLMTRDRLLLNYAEQGHLVAMAC